MQRFRFFILFILRSFKYCNCNSMVYSMVIEIILNINKNKFYDRRFFEANISAIP